MDDPLVSIIMRSFNEGWALQETLPRLQAQEYKNWELIVIDSGSTDGSVELIRRAQPRHFIQIRAEDYNPSRVMNRGMQLARADFGIFLNADATPVDSNWLRPLVSRLQDPKTAAVFGRQIPRPGCAAVYAHDYERCFGHNRESARWEHFFSMVSSGLRKDIWAQRGFLEKMQYSEDDEYTRWCRAQGYKVAYCEESVAVHSHNYTLQQAFRRSFGEAKALAAVWTRSPAEVNWPRTVLLGWLRDVRRDLKFCARHRRWSELPHAGHIRWRQRRARLAGFREGWEFYRSKSEDKTSVSTDARPRFTIDGSEALEQQMAGTCAEVLAGIQNTIGSPRVEALVLGGGYGRGQGGVLKTETGDRPYNDLEFYVFLRGNRLVNEQRFRRRLNQLGDGLSRQAGLHVEFKIDSLERFRRSPVSMFTYDLVAAHRVLFGPSGVFQGCEHHLKAGCIPLSEATRLLFNRCTGLLLVRELLRQGRLSATEADFIGRILAKAQLALGDAVLTAFGQYHWSCLERRERLLGLRVSEPLPRLAEIQRHHAAGVAFKLHPSCGSKSAEMFAAEHGEIAGLASEVWLWLESRRLKQTFKSIQDYAFSQSSKCPETSAWRNCLLNVRSFGPKAALGARAGRYPRERLFNSLPLLLWNGEVSREPEVQRHLQNQLETHSSDWAGLVAAYKEVWPGYG